MLPELFILPLNRHAEEAVQDFEDAVGIPHVHHDFPPHDQGLAEDGSAPPPPPIEAVAPPRPALGERLPGSGLKEKDSGKHGLSRFDKRDDGFMVVPEEELGRGRHPIRVLIEEASELAAKEKARIPKTFQEAVNLYRELNDASPPAGFDKWFEWCQQNEVVPWPHPAAYESILPYLSLPGPVLASRLSKLDDRIMTSIFDIKDGTLTNRGSAGAGHYRTKDLNTLLASIVHLIPDMSVYFNVDDSPARSATYTVRQRSIALAKRGELWSEEEQAAIESKQSAFGWSFPCPPDSALALQGGVPFLPDEDDSAPKQFIWSPEAATDHCAHPEYQATHGTYIFGRPNALPLIPLFTQSTTSAHMDVVFPSLDIINKTSALIPYAEKDKHKVFWRGSTTGTWHSKKWPWKTSHRERLHLLANDLDSELNVLVPKRSGRGVEREIIGSEIANKRWMDVGFSTGPSQCDEEDGSCAEMEEMFEFKARVEADKASKYRYLLDVDGNGWSARFRRLLSSGSVVFKSTVYREWISSSLIPWYHYIPVSVSYSDLYDIASFFEGSDTQPGEQHLAEEIGDHGRKFVLERWGWKDVQAYAILVLMEYNRAMSEDRTASTFADP
ncbi:glycosyl transferase family 90-domain-containing protein [Mrakia frigida]|uniref:glycosyl transferase family 90-domain-containing protein n=1 Tax=Mrakia frigida TaxID=29902 RepID=UPI003FCC1580